MSPHYLELITAALGLLLLLADAFFPAKDKRVIAWAGAAGLAVVLALLCTVASPAALESSIAGFYTADPHAMFFKGFALVATILTLILAADYTPLISRGIHGDADSAAAGRASQGGLAEFFILPVFTCAGLMWMASATDLVFLFLALELVTISFYILVAIMRRQVGSLEAGVKYLILGAMSTGVLVYGIAWVFGATGHTNLSDLATHVPGMTENLPALTFGVVLVLSALAFKIGAFPFHAWIPDVYQGAPTPVTAFLSVGSKAAGVLVFARFLEPFLDHPELSAKLVPALTVLAVGTLVVGNFGALAQKNFKRLLAYSSIAHAGFLLMGILARDFTAVTLYLGAYLLMTFAAFYALAAVRKATGGDDLRDFDGLAKRSPLLTFCLVIAAASLAGVPLTVGFLGKLAIFLSSVAAGQWFLLAVAVPAAAAGFFYYFKVIKHMVWHAPSDLDPVPVRPLPLAVLATLTAAILLLGFHTRPLANLIHEAPVVPAAVVE